VNNAFGSMLQFGSELESFDFLLISYVLVAAYQWLHNLIIVLSEIWAESNVLGILNATLSLEIGLDIPIEVNEIVLSTDNVFHRFFQRDFDLLNFLHGQGFFERSNLNVLI
jgi:hypothetical protein